MSFVPVRRPDHQLLDFLVRAKLPTQKTDRRKEALVPVGDKIKAYRHESKRLRTDIRRAQDESEQEELIARRTFVDDEIDKLAWEVLTSEQALHSDPVVVDNGVSAFVIGLLGKIEAEVERELKRDDLYPNIRDQLFKRKRALDDVKRMFHGDRRENKYAEDDTTQLLIAEFDDDSVEYAEALDDLDAEELTERMVEIGAVVARYTVMPYGGSDVVVHSPLTVMDNYYQELPPDILHRVLFASRGRVRLPDDFVAPPVPKELYEFLRLPEDE